MKLLMFYAHEWWYKTASKTLDDVPDVEKEESVAGAAAVFFHCEAEDEGKYSGIIQKFLKNTKWLAGKFNTKNVVLHSFNHLSSSKSSPEFAEKVLAEVRLRLENAGYTVMATPFGYFNEFRMHVAGASLAKVYKEF
ncbi:MAG: threonyl-tRNA synthetase editing domain-containing protein [Nitrospirota bacterium]|nr:threonyl-tRNA synthetase editing domain-containing protein [Nitrospirota bacterium]